MLPACPATHNSHYMWLSDLCGPRRAGTRVGSTAACLETVSYNSSLRLQVMEGEPYYHFKHRGTRQKALSRHWGWNMRLTKEPKVGRRRLQGSRLPHAVLGRLCLPPTTLLPTQVLWFEQQTIKRRTKRSVSVVPTDPWFHKQWYMVRFRRSLF